MIEQQAGRDVEVAHQDRLPPLGRILDEPVVELVEEPELVREFRIDLGAGNVAAGGDV